MSSILFLKINLKYKFLKSQKEKDLFITVQANGEHIWVIIKIHALFPVHILATSKFSLPFCFSLLVFPSDLSSGTILMTLR
jgi:hypothetical protein